MYYYEYNRSIIPRRARLSVRYATIRLPDVQVRMQVWREQERRTSDTTGRLSTPKACADDV